jgi:hypothetical protein
LRAIAATTHNIQAARQENRIAVEENSPSASTTTLKPCSPFGLDKAADRQAADRADLDGTSSASYIKRKTEPVRSAGTASLKDRTQVGIRIATGATWDKRTISNPLGLARSTAATKASAPSARDGREAAKGDELAGATDPEI